MLTAIWDFLFHRHKWNKIDSGISINRNGVRIGQWYDLQCEKCGAIKQKRV